MKSRLVSILPTVFFLALILLGAKFLNDPETARKIAQLGPLAPLGIIGLKISTIIIAPLGGNPIYLFAAKIFGLKMSIVYLLIGDMIGYTSAFLLSRYFGHKILKIFLSEEQHKKTHEVLNRLGTWKKFTLARITLAPLGDILSYGAGLTKLPFWKFFVTTTIAVFFYVTAVTTFGELFVSNGFRFILVIAVATCLPFILIYIRKHRLFNK